MCCCCTSGLAQYAYRQAFKHNCQNTPYKEDVCFLYKDETTTNTSTAEPNTSRSSVSSWTSNVSVTCFGRCVPALPKVTETTESDYCTGGYRDDEHRQSVVCSANTFFPARTTSFRQGLHRVHHPPHQSIASNPTCPTSYVITHFVLLTV